MRPNVSRLLESNVLPSLSLESYVILILVPVFMKLGIHMNMSDTITRGPILLY